MVLFKFKFNKLDKWIINKLFRYMHYIHKLWLIQLYLPTYIPTHKSLLLIDMCILSNMYSENLFESYKYVLRIFKYSRCILTFYYSFVLVAHSTFSLVFCRSFPLDVAGKLIFLCRACVHVSMNISATPNLILYVWVFCTHLRVCI